MPELVRILLRPIAVIWLAVIRYGLSTAPIPDDAPQAHAPGAESDRLLLMGSGPAVGVNVLSHDLALPGALCRVLSAQTRRGMVVDVDASMGMSPRDALGRLDSHRLWRYDALLFSLGVGESVTLLSAARWRRQLQALVTGALAKSAASTSIYLLEIPPITAIARVPHFVDVLTRHSREALNAVMREICDTDYRLHFVPFSPAPPARGVAHRPPMHFQAWAMIIAPALLPAFDNHSARAARDVAAANQLARWSPFESTRQAAVDELGMLDTTPEARFDRIARMAQRVFSSGSAAIALIDRDRQWNKAFVGSAPQEMSRDISVCSVVIQHDGALVVGDLQTDTRFDGTSIRVGLPDVRFYAGFPIESPSGERVGALCVFDSKPRNERDVDRALLRELAMLAQRELARPGVPQSTDASALA